MTRPGLAKTRGRPLFEARRKLVVRTFETTWRDLFAKADVVSEGSVRDEPDGRVWYGSTSLILNASEEAAAMLAANRLRKMLRKLFGVPDQYPPTEKWTIASSLPTEP